MAARTNGNGSRRSAPKPPNPTAHADGLRLFTAAEVADLLRTSPLAIYAMVARAQIPGVTRIGRRVLFRSDDLLDWLYQNRAPSPKE